MSKEKKQKKPHGGQPGHAPSNRSPKPREPKFSKAKFLRAIPDTGGVVTRIAERLECERTTVYKYMRRYPDLAAAVENERDKVLDIAEEGVLSALYAGDVATCQWFLTRKGRERGYGDKTEVDAKVDATLNAAPIFKLIIESENGGNGE